MARVEHTVVVEGTDISFSVKKGETVLKAAARNKIVFPSLCNVGECGSCRCSLKKGQIRLKRDVSHQISDEQMVKGDILACQSILQSSVELHVPTLSPANSDDPEEAKKIEARIASVVPLNTDIVDLTLALKGPLTYHAGQFSLLFVPSHPVLSTEPRSYSLARGTSTESADTVQFHVRKVPGGVFTEWLFGEDRTGESVILEGPFGSFAWSEQEGKNSKVLFIAGGSGYAPVQALLEARRDTASIDATVVYGARTQADIYCADSVQKIQEQWQGSLRFVPVLSQEPEGSDWTGLRGFVHDHLQDVVEDLPGHSAYMCGPPPMIDACLGVLGECIETNNIHYDKFLDRSHISAEEVG
ncbi:MAG: hypothetical protein DRQ65_00995 [Gammaproteobacteria bacterium]|nr:MAG: hypothetical protein DRQ98_08460 [Gammaproteobacteria bacterium]RLA57666.1 MAG: hypothetical protein DRQ65_00995 [Gammaproteobacteria bacterium]